MSREDAPAPVDAPDGEPLFGATFGLTLRLIDVRVMQRANRAFGRLSLTPASASALALVATRPDARHGEIARALAIQPPNLTKLLNQMIGEGLIMRVAATSDRRGASYALTLRGKRLAARVEATMRALDEDYLAGLDAAERETLCALLDKVAAGLG
jgi:DNA-binding MarR family transcriptional regulator